MCNLYRGPSIDISYQASGHLAKQHQKRKIFSNRPIINKNCLWWPCLLMNRDDISNFNRGPSINGSCQVSVHLAKRFQRRRIFSNWPIRNKNCLWRPWLLPDCDEMYNFHWGPSIIASYQISVHLSKRFHRRRFFRNQSVRNKNFLWWPCLSMCILYRGPSIDASYQVSVHLAKWF